MPNAILNTVILILLSAFVNALRRKMYMYLDSLILHWFIPFIPFPYVNLYQEIFILALSKNQAACVQGNVFIQHITN